MNDPPRRRSDLLLTELPEGDLVASMGDGSKALVLNAMGGAILELCDGVHGLDQIVSIVQQAFPEVDPQQVSRDVRNLLEQLDLEGALD